MDEVTRIFRRLVPERVVFLIDTCFSGAAGGRSVYDPDGTGRGLLSGEFLSRMVEGGRGRVILAASGPNESARELERLGHGVFTYFLLEGLRGRADDNRDGDVTVDEIYEYAFQEVRKATRGEQNPTRKAPAQVGQILIGRTAKVP